MKKSTLLVVFSMCAAMSWWGCSRNDNLLVPAPGSAEFPAAAPESMGDPVLAIGPIDGLTTVWHEAPKQTAIPLGTTVQFRCAVPNGAQITWYGATQTTRDARFSTAQCLVGDLKRHPVRVDVEYPNGKIATHACILRAVDISVDQIRVGPIEVAEIAPLQVGANASNDELMKYYFRESIAPVQRIEEGRYRTSVGRSIHFSTAVEPAAFSPLVEWRLDGQPRLLGTDVRMAFRHVGTRSVSIGRAANAAQVQIETYRVKITSHKSKRDLIEDGQSVTFTAVTDPPGLEDGITWLAATKHGTALPAMGRGATFTVVFNDTRPAADGLQWFGVRADNATFAQDIGAAEIFGSAMTFGLDPSDLGLLAITVTETVPPDVVSVGVPGKSSGHAAVPVVMDLEFVLSYQSVSGPENLVVIITVDNGTGQLFSGTSPVANLFDVFGLIPEPASTFATLDIQAPLIVPVQIQLFGAGVLALLASQEYHTDKGAKKANKIIMLMSGGYGAFTLAQECAYLDTLTAAPAHTTLKFTPAQLVTLKANRKGGNGTKAGDTTDSYDCHGLTFADGNSWINDNQVDKILTDNGYTEINFGTGGTAVTGDVCVFRDAAGDVIHTETVTAVDGAGVPTRSRGKWGPLGEYEHEAGVDPYDEADTEYWHSARGGGNTVKKGQLK